MNSTTALPTFFQGYSEDLLQFASMSCLVFMCIGVPGNLLTIMALLRCKQRHQPTTIFVMNLSLSDLLFGLFNLPLASSTFLRRTWTYGDFLCRLYPLFRYGLLAVSLFTVSLITINRYVIIVHPRQYSRIYRRRYVLVMVVSTWLIAFGSMLPTWIGYWGRFGLDISVGSCSILYDGHFRSPKIILFTLAFLVPCCCILVCYPRIYWLVRKSGARKRQQRRVYREQRSVEDAALCTLGDKLQLDFIEINRSLQTPPIEYSEEKDNPLETYEEKFKANLNYENKQKQGQDNHPTRLSSKDQHLLRMILIIFGSFVLCYLPITISKICYRSRDYHTFHILAYLLIYVTTCVNPLIYGLMSSDYRRAIQQFFSTFFCFRFSNK